MPTTDLFPFIRSSRHSSFAASEQQPLLFHPSKQDKRKDEKQEKHPIFDMTVWTVAAALLSCLGGFLFGKE